ncbi:ParB N-terminal domain-containing protein [Clostridium tyrobutyricum]|uniref:ParB N-terminal domain-containing protein n=1 Tax=Clostridium tyrobutyricum TaxID=1519 RepID=UPI001C37EBD7|nr:ParB N-terminal domain-containing protein [Clostridium tyrobutyricum]MBV4417681.1 ParB N-terminal domain-containing protein [Clostridium tyrobutyricum]
MQDCGFESFKIGITEISPHPKNAEIYGEDDIQELAAKIKNTGYIKPLYVNQDHVIISGHRRYKACLLLGIKQIPVVVKRFENEQEELEILLLENMYRDKTTEQKVNEAREWEIIEKEKAKQRQGTRTDIVDKCPPSNKNTVRDNCPQAEQGKTRDIVAKRVGLGSGKTLERAKPVVEKISKLRESGDTENAEFLSKALDKSISGAKKLVEDNIVEKVPKAYRDMFKEDNLSVSDVCTFTKGALEAKKRNEENQRQYEEQLKKEQQEREEKQRIEELQKTLPENAVVLDKFRKPAEPCIFGITDFNNLTEEQYGKCLKHAKKYEDRIYKTAILDVDLDCLQAWSCIYENQEEINDKLDTINMALQNLIAIQNYFKGVKKNGKPHIDEKS